MYKVYVAMHKPYRTPADDLYVPIQVGAAGKEGFASVRDDEGENISLRNQSFCELTALYWICHHETADVTGLVHYRRYFAGKRAKSRDVWNCLLGKDELSALMEQYDVLLPRKRHYVIETTYSHYAHAHHEKDLVEMRAVISSLQPEALQAFDRVMNSRSGHRFNMIIMRREALQDYCDWLFPLLFELEKRIDISQYDPYNRRVFGFIAERLLDVWLAQRNYRCKELKVLEMEKPNWLHKGGRFILRKFGFIKQNRQ